MNERIEVIDDFVDGERVDPDALKSALADAAGRDYFVSLWALREVVQSDPDISQMRRSPTLPSPSRAVAHWMMAAALVVCAAGGYALGSRSSSELKTSEDVTAALPRTVGTAPAAFPAPTPTRVIQVEFLPDASRIGGD